MKPITTSTYTFSDLIENGYVYVDKTAYIRELISDPKGQYFYARPRRFGKSLLVSTLKCIFQGRRELFKGLAIDSSDYDWVTYPVLHLDMGSTQADTLEEFKRILCNMLDRLAKEHGVEILSDQIPSEKFISLCDAVAAKSPNGKIVLLVDEYDKPLLGALNTPEVAVYRDALKAFYSVIKTKEALTRFVFITGISKFSKVSIFSDLNNLTDLSMRADFATMLGYTHEELQIYFSEHIAAFAQANGMTPEEAYAEILKWYDGYRFHHKADLVINPVSLGLCLQEHEFKVYWSETAVPTFLMDLLKKRPINLKLVNIDEEFLGTYEPDCPNVIPLLFQTGYLTITDFRLRGAQRVYSLNFPNMEVQNSFNSRLAKSYLSVNTLEANSYQSQCIDALIDGDLETFFETMKVFFANIPYEFSKQAPEETYHAVFCAILHFIGVGVQAEVSTNRGRIDAVMESPTHIYIMEFKRDASAAEALAQIKELKYYEKYLSSGKPVVLIGANFNSDTRNLDGYVVEQLNV